MSNFFEFLTALFNAVSDFLMSEPAIYFVGLSIVLFIGCIIKRFTKGVN